MSEEIQNPESKDLITRITNWYNNNEKMFMYAVVGLLVVVGGIYAYNWYIGEQNAEAQEELFSIQESFKTDSMDAVLKGSKGGMSAIDLASDYGRTKAGNLAKFYAATAFFKKGDYDMSLEYLKDFDAEGDPLLGPNRLGMMGDCYAAKKEYEQAANYFEKAGKENINDLTTPHWMLKAGAAYEKLNDFKSAVDVYEYVIDNCPKVLDNVKVEKYLSYAKARLGEYKN